MADKMMYIVMLIHKILPYKNYKYWLKRLDTQLNKATNQNSL